MENEDELQPSLPYGNPRYRRPYAAPDVKYVCEEVQKVLDRDFPGTVCQAKIVGNIVRFIDETNMGESFVWIQVPGCDFACDCPAKRTTDAAMKVLHRYYHDQAPSCV